VRVFLAGIMQGSLQANHIHRQDYRHAFKAIFARQVPGAEIYCPLDNYPDSVDYDLERARKTLLLNIEEAAASDVIVAYLPEASMGTALEMWRAWQADRVILTVSPLEHNWVINSLSTQVFRCLDELEQWLAAGGLATCPARAP
jgi:hypothetical protein